MSVVLPAIKGKMGNTEFFETKMSAQELVKTVRAAKDTDLWSGWSIEERLQRELNVTRVRNEIAPYLAESEDRFFGSILVLIYKESRFDYEDVESLAPKIPSAYRGAAANMGFLTIDGGEYIVLDGQHRLAALEMVIKKEGERIETADFSSDVPNDSICVIFIRFESSEKTRRIFSRINKYAKPTTRGDNIIMDEDDGYAILSRWMLHDDAPLSGKDSKGQSIVNWKSNTLSDRSSQLTTISAVYETIKTILDYANVPKLDVKVRPSIDDLEQNKEHILKFWNEVLEGFTCYQEALNDIPSIKDRRMPEESHSLLFKPAMQIALFKALARSTEYGLTLGEAIKKAQNIPWSMKDDVWKNIMVKPNGNIDTAKDAMERGTELITYFIAHDKMKLQDLEKIERSYGKAKGDNRSLPPVNW